MSIVRYTNPTTGRVTVYESTSYYDPVLKQSRPKRKYLGTEDPETGELIPSSKRPGRPRKHDQNSETEGMISLTQYEQLQGRLSSKEKEVEQLKEELTALKEENKEMKRAFQRIMSAISNYLPQ